MPDTVVLDLDLTGNSVANRISEEIHVVDNSTGRCIALNYGGFYTASLVIHDYTTNTLMSPGVDYIVVAPYDDITRQTGLEAACAIVFDRVNWQGTYTISYQAIGGNYATNIDALRQVLATFSEEVGSVHWNMIIGIPAEFDPAPHLVDFRSEVVGFEGLIKSIQDLSEILSSPSKGELGAILSSVTTKINEVQSQFNNSLSQLSQQISQVAGSVPSIGGLLAGEAATGDEIFAALQSNKFISAAQVSAIGQKLNSAPLVTVAQLNTTTLPLVRGSFNLRSNGGDTSVPNISIQYVIETKFIVTTTNRSDMATSRRYQVAYGFQDTSPAEPVMLFRQIPAGASPTPSLWKRIDIGAAGNAVTYNLAQNNTTPGAHLSWNAPSTTSLLSPALLKAFLAAHITGSANLSGATNLNTTTDPVVTGLFNLRSNNLGDTSVPDLTLRYIVTTTALGSALPGQYIQVAYGISGNTASVLLMRYRISTASPGQFRRADTHQLPESAFWPLLSLEAENIRTNWLSPPFNRSISMADVKYWLSANMSRIAPIGMIVMWGSNNALTLNDNWSFCHGNLLSRTTYPDLFNVIGTQFGFTSSANFRVPDLRGVVVRGLDTRSQAEGARDSDSPGRVIGNFQNDAIQNITGSFRANTYTSHGNFNLIDNFSGALGLGLQGPATRNIETSSTGFAMRDIVFNASNSPNTRTNNLETRVKNVALNFIIKIA